MVRVIGKRAKRAIIVWQRTLAQDDSQLYPYLWLNQVSGNRP